MRKKASRPTSSRNSTAKPQERRALQITKETIRTLRSDELTQVDTGIVICPNSTATQTQHDTNDPGDTIRNR